MLINRDPDGKPDITPEMIRMAEENHLQIVNVVCDSPNAKVGDRGGVSFLTLTPSIPHAGERIILEDGKRCDVRRIMHKVVTQRDEAGKAVCILLVPTVDAVMVDDRTD